MANETKIALLVNPGFLGRSENPMPMTESEKKAFKSKMAAGKKKAAGKPKKTKKTLKKTKKASRKTTTASKKTKKTSKKKTTPKKTTTTKALAKSKSKSAQSGTGSVIVNRVLPVGGGIAAAEGVRKGISALDERMGVMTKLGDFRNTARHLVGGLVTAGAAYGVAAAVPAGNLKSSVQTAALSVAVYEGLLTVFEFSKAVIKKFRPADTLSITDQTKPDADAKSSATKALPGSGAGSGTSKRVGAGITFGEVSDRVGALTRLSVDDAREQRQERMESRENSPADTPEAPVPASRVSGELWSERRSSLDAKPSTKSKTFRTSGQLIGARN